MLSRAKFFNPKDEVLKMLDKRKHYQKARHSCCLNLSKSFMQTCLLAIILNNTFFSFWPSWPSNLSMLFNAL